MTRNEKKAVIESMAEKFMNIDDLEGKSMTIMVMSAYAEGIVQCQRTGAAGGKTGDDASGSDTESGNNDTDGREHRGQIQGV